MGSFLVSLPPIWEAFLKGLAEDHDIDVSKVISGLCDWAFSSADYKVQFEVWLDKAYPPKGQAEDRARVRGEEESTQEEARQDREEEEAHEDRDYSEDRSAGRQSMIEKETIKKNEQEPTAQTTHLKRQPPRYTYEDQKEAPKIHESETESKPKKQRQQKRER